VPDFEKSPASCSGEKAMAQVGAEESAKISIDVAATGYGVPSAQDH
jgi:hypothetical protein